MCSRKRAGRIDFILAESSAIRQSKNAARTGRKIFLTNRWAAKRNFVNRVLFALLATFAVASAFARTAAAPGSYFLVSPLPRFSRQKSAGRYQPIRFGSPLDRFLRV